MNMRNKTRFIYYANFYRSIMTTKAMVYIGIAIGVAAMAGAVVYGTANQQNYVAEDAKLAPAAEQGAFTSDSGMVALNKEQWHEDPFGDIAAKVREQAGAEKTVTPIAKPIEKPMVEEPPMEEPMVEEPPMEEPSGPQTVSVDMPAGTAVPGCEETNECYIPASVTINAGDTVEWTNSDTAAHTVTGGSPADGPSGVFDSSLVLGGAQYAFTFEEAGSYDYFCMVHPWMVGNVQVN
jgi:plastocyanin